MRAAFVAAAVALLAAGASAAAENGFAPIVVTARAIPTFGRHGEAASAGTLEYRGGLELKSSDPRFGSLSGLDVAADGHTLYAVADTGFWFKAEFTETGGRLTGIGNAELAPILDKAGNVVVSKRLGDAEGLRLTTYRGKPAALVSFEQVNNVRRFVADPDFAGTPSEVLKLPAMVSGMPPNKGLEAIAVAPEASPLKGAIVLIAEHSLDAGRGRAWIVGGPLAGAFFVSRKGDFDFTDAVFLENGDMLILERRFNFSEGVGMRIRRIAGTDLKPGATVDGQTLIEADLRDEIDNMEGLAVTKGENGEWLLLVVSDDNQSILQRTLLLQFALKD
ncbi:MAG TPA: esterase-like activity of phytase family protein [Bauldia sp.]|nr:esterase-like activity of phytase family protein [Bauldia sp.]